MTSIMSSSLAEGSQFALTSNVQRTTKSMIFVKLTDSAVKAVEDYVNALAKGDIDAVQKALFQLCPNAKGLLTIPGHNGEVHTYNFSIKDVQNDGILECVQQTDQRSMQSLGKVRLRMQIHANDDIYQATKHKMALAAEESKKNNTVILDDDQPTGTIITRKVKRPFGNKFGTASNIGNLSAIHNNNNNNNNATQPTTTATTTVNNTANNTTVVHNSRYKLANNVNANTTNNNNNNIVNTGSISKFGLTSGANVLSEASKKSVREHIIHLLAVRPYKISELMPRVQEREPMADKNVLVNILNEVSMFREGAYQLNDASWMDVQLEWTLFNKEDRDAVMRRHPLMHNNNNNNNTLPTNKAEAVTSNNNNISPKSDNINSPANNCSPRSLSNSPTTGLVNGKQPALSPYDRNLSLKRVREGLSAAVANNLKKHKNIEAGNNFRGSNNVVASSLARATTSPRDTTTMPPYKSMANSFYQQQQQQQQQQHHQQHSQSQPRVMLSSSGNGAGSINSSPNSSPDSGASQNAFPSSHHHHHHGNSVGGGEGCLNFDTDYLSKYTRIQSQEQLLRYKRDFEKLFPEYQKMFEYIESICSEFTELEESIQHKDEDSDEWNDIIKYTIEKYDEIKTRTSYSVRNKRLLQLHAKLTHIKNLINEFTGKTRPSD